MRVEDDGNELTFHFSPFKLLIVSRVNRTLKYDKFKIRWDEIKGFWKNYRIRGRKKVYYVVLLTVKQMDRITPELDEYDTDEVLRYLKEVIDEEVKK